MVRSHPLWLWATGRRVAALDPEAGTRENWGVGIELQDFKCHYGHLNDVNNVSIKVYNICIYYLYIYIYIMYDVRAHIMSCDVTQCPML